jgi:shikimate kinase
MTSSRARHIVLTGAMGVGKTTVGERLAMALARPFIDSDRVLEERVGMTGAEVAARDGVERLHQIELEVFAESCGSEHASVIAAASSVVDNPEGRRLMTEHTTVLLTAPDDVITERADSGDHRRPVDAGVRASLLGHRAPYLAEVTIFRVDTGSLAPDVVVDRILDLIQSDPPT